MWFENKVMLNSGCGIVAGYDAVMRLLDEDEFSKDDYMAAPFKPVRLVSESGHEEKEQFHWVTVTGFDGNALTVSSWGNKYTIDLKDITRFGSTAAFYAVLTKTGSDPIN